MALALCPYGPKFLFQEISENCIFLHIKLELSVKLFCVGPVLSRHWMFLVPYYSDVSYHENHKKSGQKGEEKGRSKVPFQNTCFGAVINAARPVKIKQL